MPIELREHQHELTTEDGSVSFLFGTEDTSYLTLKRPTFSSTDTREGDVERVREDGTDFGEDFLGGKTMGFEVGVLTDRAPDPLRAGGDALGLMEYHWKNPRLRNRSNKIAVLRSCVGGRITRAYGRPRRFDPADGPLSGQGYTPLVADFKVQDGTWYDDEPQVAAINLAVATDGGFFSPLVAPLTTVEATADSRVIRIGGLSDTWPVVRFHGPTSGVVSEPTVTFGPFTIGLERDVPAGAVVTVDPRPWVREATRGDGANYAGDLTWETPPMRRLTLAPGAYTVGFTGEDLSGSAWVEVEWRNAYPRP